MYVDVEMQRLPGALNIVEARWPAFAARRSSGHSLCLWGRASFQPANHYSDPLCCRISHNVPFTYLSVQFVCIVYHCATFVQGGPWAIHISVNVLLWHLVRPQMVHLQVCICKYVLNSVSLGLVWYRLGPTLCHNCENTM
jgi:hypothetical protein